MPSFVENLLKTFERLSGKQKLQLAVALVATVGVVWGTALYATRVRYGVLLSGSDPEEAAEIVELLREKEVPYRLKKAGTS